jgi:hypothetical protein
MNYENQEQIVKLLVAAKSEERAEIAKIFELASTSTAETLVQFLWRKAESDHANLPKDLIGKNMSFEEICHVSARMLSVKVTGKQDSWGILEQISRRGLGKSTSLGKKISSADLALMSASVFSVGFLGKNLMLGLGSQILPGALGMARFLPLIGGPIALAGAAFAALNLKKIIGSPYRRIIPALLILYNIHCRLSTKEGK